MTTAHNNSHQRHVHFLVLAQFDITTGSSISQQYPEPVTCKEFPNAGSACEQFLAEMMLPDGLHKRDDDWTIFFLNRDEQVKGGPKESLPHLDPSPTAASSKQQQHNYNDTLICPPFEAFLYEYAEGQDEGWCLKGKKSVYLLPGCVEVHEMSGETTYAINKHEDLDYTQLEPMFSCVLLDTGAALGFRFPSEEVEATFSKHIDDIIDGNFPDTSVKAAGANDTKETNQDLSSSVSAEQQRPFLYCLNRVTNLKDDSVKRGAVVKAISLCSPHPFIHVFKPLLVLALDNIFKAQGKERDILAQLYDSINSIDLREMPSLTMHQMLMLRMSQTPDKAKTEFSTKIRFTTPISIKIPLTVFPDEVSDFQVIPLVKKFQGGTMTLLNAALMEKRILFLGKDIITSDEICNCVLAIVGMMCPPLTGIIQRSFPYTNIASLDFLNKPGYIAGVANNLFEEKVDWWDVLADVETGKIILNPQTMSAEKQPYTKHDNDFFLKVITAITNHMSDEHIKHLFQEYVKHILDIALGQEEFCTVAERQIAYDANRVRIEAWKKTSSFETYKKAIKQQRKQSAIQEPKVERCIRKLRIRTDITESEMIEIYDLFTKHITTKERVIEVLLLSFFFENNTAELVCYFAISQFLSLLPESQGGLNPLAVNLFHSSPAVRQATVQLFHRLDSIQVLSFFAFHFILETENDF
ncbi:Spindle pole body interacting protein, variant 2 [Balamuthia mandrillaris]